MGEKERCPAWCIRPGSLPTIRLLVVLSALFALPVHAQGFLMMQADCGGILTAKEGLRPGLEDYVDLSSIHHDLSVPLNFGSTSVSPGKMSVDALRVVKSLSASSIGMIGEMARGRPCTQILIEHWIQTADTTRPIWKMTLAEAYIVERKEWHAGAEVPPQESFGFFPSQLQWTYFLENGSPVEFGWDFLTSSVR